MQGSKNINSIHKAVSKEIVPYTTEHNDSEI